MKLVIAVVAFVAIALFIVPLAYSTVRLKQKHIAEERESEERCRAVEASSTARGDAFSPGGTADGFHQEPRRDDPRFSSRWAAAFLWFLFGGSALAILLSLARHIVGIEEREVGMVVSLVAAASGLFGGITRKPLPWLGCLDTNNPTC